MKLKIFSKSLAKITPHPNETIECKGSLKVQDFVVKGSRKAKGKCPLHKNTVRSASAISSKHAV
jgi:hypothetical protein